MKHLSLIFLALFVFNSQASQTCLDKSELVLSQTSTFGECELVQPLKLRTKQLFCENQLLDQWNYWAGTFELKEIITSKVLVQITNVCSQTIIQSEIETRVSTKMNTFKMTDNRSLYPEASSWFVYLHEDAIDTIDANSCMSFDNNSRRNDREVLMSESEARSELAIEKSNCEKSRF